MIKAPYNFIPLSKQVVFPEWASSISHDIPFSDGISGSISVRLTADSPIFVRNGHSRADQEKRTGEFASFSHIGNRYFLPGTTVKGVVRNVLEILSFGKMDVDRNARFAQREWDNSSLYPLKKEVLKLHCGWLCEKEGGDYEIIDCGLPYRISHKEIDAYFGNNTFEKEFSQKSNQILGRNLNAPRKVGDEEIDPKTSYYKYRLVEKMGSLEQLRDLSFMDLGTSSRRVSLDPDGDIQGSIVLTGQPDLWMYPRPKTQTNNAGKFYEFVFRNPGKMSKRYPLSEDDMEQYKFIYSDSPDWKYANEKLLPKSGIPVFFRIDGKGDKIKDWGLALLYKLPYAKTSYESLPEDHRKEEHDMADCIFGYSGKENSLKGRVQFSHFMSDNAVADTRSSRLVLNGPKASYYPIYIDQAARGKDGKMNGPHQYLTYNDGTPSGWKRYLRRANTWEKKTDSDKLDTILHPLLPGAVFDGKIRFHNLRPEELGALLSALTFHGNESQCRHQIGMAKPYGYGKMRCEIMEIDLVSVGEAGDDALSDVNGYMSIFEKYMDKALLRPWVKSAPVCELLTVAGFDVPGNDGFDYMTLEMNGPNEFNIAKGGRNQTEFPPLYLQRYSALIRKSYSPGSLESASGASGLLEKQRLERQAEKRRREEEELIRAKAVREELARKEAERLEEERRQDELKKEEENRARNAEKAAGGLSFLEEKFEEGPNAGKYKIDEFKKARSRISQYLKIIGDEHIPEDQWDRLESCLLRLAGNPSRDEKRKKLWSLRDSNLWNYIGQMTSTDFADRVYEAIQHKTP